MDSLKQNSPIYKSIFAQKRLKSVTGFFVCSGVFYLSLKTIAYQTSMTDIPEIPQSNFTSRENSNTTLQPRIRLDRPVTVVTAYYRFKSKHKVTEYLDWMRNFLTDIPCYLYIFTDGEQLRTLKQLRAPFLSKTKFIVRRLPKLKMARKRDIWKQQKSLDYEPYHTPELYMIWNEKPSFLLEAVQDNVFDSDYFIWTDIGAFRNRSLTPYFRSYPDTNITAAALGTDKMFFLQMNKFNPVELVIGQNGLPQYDFALDRVAGARVTGTIYGGHAKAVIRYTELYYKTSELMRVNGRFIGKDQNVMAAMAVLYPDFHHLVLAEPYLNGADPWFYGEYYLSKRPKSVLTHPMLQLLRLLVGWMRSI